MEPLISLDNVTKSYAVNGQKTIGVENVSFDVFPNEIVSLIGPSGCGKTTILKMIANLIDPTNGSIRYQKDHISLARKKGLLGYVPQNTSLLPNRTVTGNIALPLEIKGRSDTRKVASIVELVDLAGFEDYYPHHLSGGMKQKVSIARALVHHPEVLLMDEPFASLDEITREKLDSRLLTVFYELKPAIVFVTHSVEEAVFISTRILIMSKAPGKIIDTIRIDLPGRRDVGIKNTEAYFREVVRIREKIRSYE
jgi:NitT/TauT family transport system ATP-binding protein